MVDYKMKAEGASEVINAALNVPAPQFERTVGALRAALSHLPADMPIKMLIEGTDSGVCEITQLDADAGRLMIIGACATPEGARLCACGFTYCGLSSQRD
jgi:hypothetical protein